MAEYNAPFNEYQDAIERVLRYWHTHNKTLPDYVTINGLKFYITDYLDAVNRVQQYIDKNKKTPPMVWFRNTTTPTPPAPVTDWVLTGYFQQDYQNTSYTCGPSSAQMVFSALGLPFNESQIASLAGTTTAGTSHQQLYTAMRKLYPSLDIAEYYLSDIGFDGIIGKLKNNCEIILHIRTGPLRTDADGNGVWQNDYGHYIFLEGVNPVTNRVRVFDPTKGNKEFTYNQMTNAINAVSNQKSVMVFYKP